MCSASSRTGEDEERKGPHMSLEDRIKGLSEEQKAKARAASSPEQMLEIAKEEGFELSDEELEAVAGGWHGCSEFVPGPTS